MRAADWRTGIPRAGLAGSGRGHDGYGGFRPFAVPASNETARAGRLYESLGRNFFPATAAADNVDGGKGARLHDYPTGGVVVQSARSAGWAGPEKGINQSWRRRRHRDLESRSRVSSCTRANSSPSQVDALRRRSLSRRDRKDFPSPANRL